MRIGCRSGKGGCGWHQHCHTWSCAAGAFHVGVRLSSAFGVVCGEVKIRPIEYKGMVQQVDDKKKRQIGVSCREWIQSGGLFALQGGVLI